MPRRTGIFLSLRLVKTQFRFAHADLDALDLRILMDGQSVHFMADP